MTAVGDEITGHIVLDGWSVYDPTRVNDNCVLTDSAGNPLDAASYESGGGGAEPPHMFSYPIATTGVKVAVLDSGTIYLYGRFYGP